MTLPMEGIRILDLSRFLPGGLCSMILGDMGADVLKVEQPGWSEHSVEAGSTLSAEQEERLAAYHALDRNKRSIALNLKSEEARSILYRLVEEADILLESSRPGVAKRLGIDYETLSKINPRLIYCSITGYGQDGPYRDLPGHDINYLAIAGALGVLNEGGGPPIVSGLKISDIGGGALPATIGVLLALRAREKTGRGQYIDIAMADGTIAWLSGVASLYFESGQVPPPDALPLAGKRPGFNAYKTKDGKYISLGLREPHLFQNFCKAIGREDFIPDQNTPGQRRQEMISQLKGIFLTKTREEWFSFLREKDVSVGPVYTIDEVFADPHVLHRKMLVEVDHPKLGKIKQVGIPIKLSDTPGRARTPAPLSGQHTEEVLLELGYTREQIEELREQGAIK